MTARATPRCRLCDAESVCFLSVITAPELYSASIYPPASLALLFPLRTYFVPPPSRVKYTYTLDIFASRSPLTSFSIHEGLSTQRTTRKAGCIEREKCEVARERRERKRKNQGRGYANRGPVRKRKRDKEREGGRMRVLRESPVVKEGKEGCRGGERRSEREEEKRQGERERIVG